LLVSVLLLATAKLWPADIRHIGYKGRSLFSEARMNGIIGFSQAGGLSTEALKRGVGALLAQLSSAGCFMAELELEYSSDSTKAIIKIINGIIPVAGEVGICGNSYLGNAYLTGLLAVREGQPITTANIFADISAVSLSYADLGFPHAKIKVGDFSISDTMVNYNYKIEEGPRVVIDNIRFVGNHQTKYGTALRFSGLSSGLLFGRKVMEKGRTRLMKSGLFRSVSEPMLTISTNPGLENLTFTVEERRYNNLIGAIGYNQDEARQKGWLTGSIDLSFSNLGGSGIQTKVSWQRLTQEKSRLSAAFSTPWLFSFDIGLAASIAHRIEDSTYTQSSGRILAEFPAGDHFTAGVGAEAVRVVPGSAMLINRYIIYNSLWSVEADYRNNDDIITGLLIKLELEYGRKRYYNPAVQLTLSRLKLFLSHKQSTFKRQFIYAAAHWQTVISSEKPVPRSDQFSMGGALSLRGYWEDQFVANQLAWTNIEYRFLPDKRLELFPFYDLGYFYDLEREQRGYRSGYGVGFRMNTALGWISLVYGLGKGDKWRQGKVHIGLDSDF
jgi:outer membrane protein insertion porin family